MSDQIAHPLLWPQGPPGTSADPTASAPSLTVFQPDPDRANGAAIVVCPGGGYQGLADHEAEPVATWLTTLGITAFLLRYRLAPAARHPAMLQDAQRALRTVRATAETWQVDPRRIGILGFSAGGHLASTAATHFDSGDPQSADAVEQVSSRPDLAILIYPVITMQPPFAHAGSRTNLLGDTPDHQLTLLLSNELRVGPETPPMFLAHGANDAAVPVENSLLMAQALSRVHVPFELHVYESGPHGFGLQPTSPGMSPWTERCAEWLRARRFLKPSSPAQATT